MAYQCPRCGSDVQRGSSTTAGVAGGLVGALIYSAFGSFRCKKCGPITRGEFAPDVRQRMLLGSVGLVITGILILVLVVCLLAYFQR